MEYYEFDWWKFILFMVLIGLFLAGIDKLMKKIFKIEKRKRFSHNHMNEQHKKWDRYIRVSVLILIIVAYFINVGRETEEAVWFLKIWVILPLLILFSEGLRAFMEWKYASNRKQYIYTISMMGVYLFFLSFIMIASNAGWLDIFLY